MFKIIFSLPFFVASLALGVGLWFLIDYLERFRLESALIDNGVILAMACFFGIVFYAIVAVFAIPIRAVFIKK